MKITELQIGQLTIPLTKPFITAVRRTECVDDVVVLIKTDTGHIGYGSAASTPAITGDNIESIISAIKNYLGPQLIGRSVTEFNHLLQMNHQAIEGNTSPKAAIDIALHDVFAQYCGVPLYQLLGGNQNSIHSCITISVKAIEDMVQDALDLTQQGFTTLKIKLGLNPIEDLQRIQTIRNAVGPEVLLLLDANQGWSYEGALNVLDECKQQQLNISLVEQPVIAHDLTHLKKISAQSTYPIIADEACFSPEDALNIAQMKACNGLNIKLMKSGGLANAQAIYHIARTAQMRIMVGCMLESPIGVGAITSFAVSKPDIFFADLDPIYLIRENFVQGGVQRVGNKVVLSEKPGLGIEGISQGFNLVGVIR